jgi:hypothetical protein
MLDEIAIRRLPHFIFKGLMPIAGPRKHEGTIQEIVRAQCVKALKKNPPVPFAHAQKNMQQSQRFVYASRKYDLDLVIVPKHCPYA